MMSFFSISKLSRTSHSRSISHGERNKDAKNDSLPVVKSPMLPDDVLLEIAECLWDVLDVLSFSLTSHRTHALLHRALYARVDLRSNDTCRNFLDLLRLRPERGLFIRSLTVRPNFAKIEPAHDYEESSVALGIRTLADGGHLRNLRAFIWDGLTMPDDQLWTSLQKSCGHLKSVGSTFLVSNFGHNENHLFDFTDLISFSLIIKDDRRTLHSSELPPRFWSMLMRNCLSLRDLSITGDPETWNLVKVGRIMEGRWPELHSLRLGNFSDRVSEADVCLSTVPFWRDFLSAHMKLKHLCLGGSRVVPKIDAMPPGALQLLEEFSGSVNHLWTIENTTSLTMLRLTGDPLGYRGFEGKFITMLHTVLKKLPSLTTLGIWLEVKEMHEYEPLLRNILICSPNVRHLELIGPFDHSLSFLLVQDALKGASSIVTALETVEVTVVYGPTKKWDEAVNTLACSHPHLRQVVLKSPSQASQYITRYEVLRGPDGAATKMKVRIRNDYTGFKKEDLYPVQQPRIPGDI